MTEIEFEVAIGHWDIDDIDMISMLQGMKNTFEVQAGHQNV